MNKRFRSGCFLLGGIILLLVLAAGGWVWYRSIPSVGDSTLLSPVQVFLLSPSSGAEVKAGDYVPVTTKAISPKTILKTELFVDGQSLGTMVDSPDNASWTWQAFPAGVHTFYARATDANGSTGQSQTVIVNVLTGSGVIQVPAQEGQTLQQIGANYGASPDQMAAANPHVDPGKPLKDGQPVQVPAPGGGAGNGSGSGGGQPQPPSGGSASGPFLISIVWNIKFNEPVDQSYCYTSNGDGKWSKIPQDPFTFFQSLDNLYTQLTPAAGQVVIQADCWGWMGGALKYLGQGQTTFDIKQPPSQVMIAAPGFQFVGTPQIPTGYGGGPTLDVSPPYALREPMNAADCTAHSNPLLAPFICNTILNAPIKENIILEWEWAKPTCWPGYCGWTDSIDGYRLYEFNTATKAEKYLKEIANPSQKITLIPLPWGATCYGVRAYVNTPAFLESDLTTYCPGQPPAPQQAVLTPTQWLTTGGQWIQDGDCDTYGLADHYEVDNQKSGFGNQPGEILVGGYVVDNEDADCFRQGDYSGAVRFDMPLLPSNAVIQKAVLKFSEIHTDYGASGLATNYKLFCASGVSTAKQDWTGVGSPIHFWGDNILHSTAYNSPLTSLSEWNHAPEVDVTAIVNKWIKSPAQNKGFILTGANAPSPLVDGSGECLSQVGNFQLEIDYFAQ